MPCASAQTVTPQVDSTETHSLALDANGQVYAWGSDSRGQLGQGRSLNRTSPTRVPGLPQITDMSIDGQVLAVDIYGRVWSWGDNSCGAQLGPRDSSNTSRPAKVKGISDVKQVAAGACFSVALKNDGTVWVWGLVLGLGDTFDTGIRQVQGLSGIVEIAAGFAHVLARKGDGTVFAFGLNDMGQLGTGVTGAAQPPVQVPGISGATTLAAAIHSSMVLLSNGEVRAWGQREDLNTWPSPTALPGLGGAAVSISIGDARAYVARADGRIFYYFDYTGTWIEETGFVGIAKVVDSANQAFVLGVDGSGQLFAKGSNVAGQLGQGDTLPHNGVVAVPGFTNTSRVRAAVFDAKVLALKSDGSLWFWGQETAGESGTGVIIGSSIPLSVGIPAVVKAVAAGGKFSLALDVDGNVWAWGDNASGAYDPSRVSRSTPQMVAGVSNVQAVAAGDRNNALFLMADGTVWLLGELPFLPIGPLAQIAGFDHIVAIASTSNNAYALRQDGKVLALGANSNGELGNGTTTNSATPVIVNIPGTVTRIAAAFGRAAAITSDGRVWSWGAGPAGTGDTLAHTTPVQVPGITTAADISVGSAATFVRLQDGTILNWGYSIFQGGQALSPNPVPFYQPVSAVRASGGINGFIIGSTGLLWGFGSSGAGPYNPTVGDGTYVTRNAPVVVLAPDGFGALDGHDWFLDLDPSSPETIPASAVPRALAISHATGGDNALSLDARIKYMNADLGKNLSNFVLARVPPSFLGLVKTAQTISSADALAKRAAKDGGFVLAQLTPSGWSDVSGQLIAYSEGVGSAAGGASSILNGIDTTLIPGASFCVGYGTSADAMLASQSLREVLVIEGSSTVSGVPCVLSGIYVSGPPSSFQSSPVTFTAAVVGFSPTGSVQFKDGGGGLGSPVSLTVANPTVGLASITTSSLALGTHSIGAQYPGDAVNGAAVAIPKLHSVLAPQAQTRVELAGPLSSEISSEVTFVAMVTGNNPTGTVQFRDGSNSLGNPIGIVAGVATLRTSTLDLGVHLLTAAYSGDGANPASTSAVLSHNVVGLLSTHVDFSTGPNPVDFGGAIAVSVTVTGTNPTGTVSVREGATVLASKNLSGGSASLSIAGLAAGVHVLTADYSGDGPNPPATSGAIFQQVSLPSGLVPLAVTSLGFGSGTVTSVPAGIDCGSTCSASFLTGNSVTLTAAAAAGSEFGGWSLASCPGLSCTVAAGAVGTVKATFRPYSPIPRVSNISTRGQVQTGFNVMIGGFVISGTTSKTVIVRAIGPSLADFGVQGAIADPTLKLVHSGDNSVIAVNDDWGAAANAAQIQASGFAPSNAKESAILVTLAPGGYTAIVSGVGDTTGVGLIEVYEVDHFEVPLINISTRGRVETGFGVMIGGFVIQGTGPQTVVVRAIGPSLANFGVAGAIANPSLKLVRSSDQAVLAENDDWVSSPNAAQIQASTFAPSSSLESAIYITLDPGGYTAIVSGGDRDIGVGLVEVYKVGQ